MSSPVQNLCPDSASVVDLLEALDLDRLEDEVLDGAPEAAPLSASSCSLTNRAGGALSGGVAVVAWAMVQQANPSTGKT